MLPTHWKIAGSLVAGVSLMLIAEAADPIKLDVKPGLWEIASEGQINGAPPVPEDVLARLTPEQRARFEASMQASMANAAKPRLSKHCMTPEKIQRGLDMEQQNNASCQRKVLSNSASKMDISEDCSDANGTTSIGEHFELSGPEQITGTVHVVRTAGGKSMTVNSTIHGKWLGASCGDIKDFELEK
jgi:Protein of unknown function (DUF3617)